MTTARNDSLANKAKQWYLSQRLVVRQSKIYIINVIQEFFEPALYNEFISSLDPTKNGIYIIFDHDIPTVRDFKAILNMITAVENAFEKVTDKYALWAVSFFKKIEALQDVAEFIRNYNIYMSTNSLLRPYLWYMKEVTITTILPKVVANVHKALKFVTVDNIQESMDFAIEQFISIERYKEEYLQQKLKPQKEIDEKEEKEDGLITTIVTQSDAGLKRLYKDNYNENFSKESKLELMTEESKLEKKENKIAEEKPDILKNYYLAKKDEDPVVKHIKLLLNGIIGISKVIEDYKSYNKANLFSSVPYMKTFYNDLKITRAFFQEFDYQAIVAQKTKSLAEYLKTHLIILNGLLERIACIADQFENEMGLKEGALLKHVDSLILLHNQITTELKIPTDYILQKNIYYKTRMLSRERSLVDIDSQMVELRGFIVYKDHALTDIPYFVILAMQNFIAKYDDISMNSSHLEKYKIYLIDALVVKRGFKSFIKSQFEYLANLSHLTIHSEMMSSFTNRLLYLEKQKTLLNERCLRSKKYFEQNPYANFKLSDLVELGHHQAIVQALKKHVMTLDREKEHLQTLISAKSSIVVASDSKTSTTVEEKVKPKIKVRLDNKVKLNAREFGFFSAALSKYETSSQLNGEEIKAEPESGFTSASVVLLDEISDVCRRGQRS